MTKPVSVIIAGAGIAGLSAAIALSNQGLSNQGLDNQGFDIRIFEKAPVLSEQGAGIQLGPNATSILRHWSLEEALLARACTIEAIELHDGMKGQHLTSLPVGQFARHHWHAPYVTLHRADLQSLLKQAIESNPRIHLQCNATVCNLAGDLANGFEIEIATPIGTEKHRCDLFLACDGVWSDLRNKIGKGDEAQFSGSIAWRATIERSTASTLPDPAFLAPAFVDSKNVRVFMGAKGHFIAYPIRGGDEINLVAITGSKTAYSGDKANLSRCFNSWHPAIMDIMTKDFDWTYWPLFARSKPYFLSPQGVVFLGDSAHAMTPFAAQGAAMALEDAACLAAYLPYTDFLSRRDRVPQSLKTFAIERSNRVSHIAKRAAFNRFVYHAGGPVAAIRNLALKARPPEKFLSDLDWLYRAQTFRKTL